MTNILGDGFRIYDDSFLANNACLNDETCRFASGTDPRQAEPGSFAILLSGLAGWTGQKPGSMHADGRVDLKCRNRVSKSPGPHTPAAMLNPASGMAIPGAGLIGSSGKPGPGGFARGAIRA
ncbi:MAG: hypothetical protein ACREFY_18810 [Acetobacteraceae bacterium]